MNAKEAEEKILNALGQERPNSPRVNEIRVQEATLHALRGIMGELELLRKIFEFSQNPTEEQKND